MSHFAFLQGEFPEIYDFARRAEQAAKNDARAACFYARLGMETAIKWLFDHDPSLSMPPDGERKLLSLMYEPAFKTLVGELLVTKLTIIRKTANYAVHSPRPVAERDGITCVRELFHFAYWVARTYAQGDTPPPTLEFLEDNLPDANNSAKLSDAALKKLESQHAAAQDELIRQREILLQSEAEREKLDEEIRNLKAAIAETKKKNAEAPDTHNYNEAQTRRDLIDADLREAGWNLTNPRDTEYPVMGMPNETGSGFVDYVLWGDDGLPLALIEAKRTSRDSWEGQQQAKLYADCLETKFNIRPLIFFSNGYHHWVWDDKDYPPREVSGFYKKSELQWWRQRKQTRNNLTEQPVDEKIAGRFYQTRAIQRIAETFEKDNQRKALLVMATGSGKTRTVVALADIMMRGNHVKRILFLADRRELVKQAKEAFVRHLPNSPIANLIEQHDPKKNDHNGARICVATYQTMMNKIDEMENQQRRYGAAHFDLIVVDEAHRSVYRKYKGIFEYFDSFLVGLTATPREEIDRDTYALFGLEAGIPTDSYDLTDAVNDGYLVPPTAISVPLKFVREGIRYDKLSEEEKAKWDELEWEGKLPPEGVESGAINSWLFNEDTIDKVLEVLMTKGIKVKEEDRLGKTIIFAKNHDHAVAIAKCFDKNYPHLAGHFARVIDYQTDYTDSLIETFKKPDDNPHIAISVDMLDTGIDVPEVVNLVFFKMVRSKTKFWQMVGRGTRLCPDLLGPGQDKTTFCIFDFCQNLEFFIQNPKTVEGTGGKSLSEKLFVLRTKIVAAMQNFPEREMADNAGKLYRETRQRLMNEVLGMTTDNFLVKKKRQVVEKFQQPGAWENLSPQDINILTDDIAGLPTALTDNDIEAKQFDHIVLRGILDHLQGSDKFSQCKKHVIYVASELERKSNIPLIKAHLDLIQDLQTDRYWENIDGWSLEEMRRKIRDLVKLMDRESRKIVFTNFKDIVEEIKEVEMPYASVGVNKKSFEDKVRRFLDKNKTHVTILKLRQNQPLTPDDLKELERIMTEETGVEAEDWKEVEERGGLGIFIRSLVGLDREAAKNLFADFIKDRNLNANQIEFINMIINDLTEHGLMEAKRLFESPYTDFNDNGVIGLFPPAEVQEIVKVLNTVKDGTQVA